MGMIESMPQRSNFIAVHKLCSKRRKHKRRQTNMQNQPANRQPLLQWHTQQVHPQQECKTEQPDDLCDFPKISVQAPLNDIAPSNAAEDKSASPQVHNGTQMREIRQSKITSRRYSDLYVCARAYLTAARRRNSAPSFRDANMMKSDNNATDNCNESNLPKNSPCKPDLITCCQNWATFLADAAANGRDSKNAPSAPYIYSYMRFLFTILQLEPECCVYADIYLRRLLANGKGKLKVNSKNWNEILVGACLLASKYVDDLSMGNRDFSKVLTGCSVQSVNKLESKFVHMLNWRLHVPISEYTTRYFELVSKQDSDHDWDSHFTIKPHFNLTCW